MYKVFLDAIREQIIFRNPSRRGWYEDYEIKDENIINKANEIWKDIRGD